jgi:hypothetical protein
MSDANGDISTIMLNKTSDVIRKIRMIGLSPNNMQKVVISDAQHSVVVEY